MNASHSMLAWPIELWHVTPMLPIELWHAIMSLLPRRDLRNMTLVSRYLSSIAWLVLAENITIAHLSRHPEQGPESIVRLFNQNVMHRVKRLSLIWQGGQKDLNIAHLEFMRSLRALSIRAIGDIPFFRTDFGQECFFLTLNFTKIQEFSFLGDDDVWVLSNMRLPPSVVRLEWEDRPLGGISTTFLALCRASASHLTHISVVAHTDELTDYIEFFSLRFSKLKHLSIGPGNDSLFDDDDDVDVFQTFRDFLLAHPTIEVLHLSHGKDEDDVTTIIPFARSPPMPHVLPNLRDLHAHPTVIVNLAGCGMESLHKLHTLRISSYTETDCLPRVTPSMCAHLKTMYETNGPFKLHTLVMQLYLYGDPKQWFPRDQMIEAIRQLAEIFPDLHTYIGDFFDESILAEEFVKFKRVRIFSFPIRDLKHALVETLVQNIPTLEKVTCFKSGLTFYIFRGTDGIITIDKRMVIIPDADVTYGQYLDDETSSDESEESEDESGESGDEPEESEDEWTEDQALNPIYGNLVDLASENEEQDVSELLEDNTELVA